MNRVSRQEALRLGLSKYFTGKPCKHGHVSERWTAKANCFECARIRRHTEEHRAYQRAHRDVEYHRKYAVRHFQENKGIYLAALRKYQATKLRATPRWLTKDQRKEMAALYVEAATLSAEKGEAYHVDHIIPLQGGTVCGLHVPWNLQVITGKSNLKKGIRYESSIGGPVGRPRQYNLSIQSPV